MDILAVVLPHIASFTEALVLLVAFRILNIREVGSVLHRVCAGDLREDHLDSRFRGTTVRICLDIDGLLFLGGYYGLPGEGSFQGCAFAVVLLRSAILSSAVLQSSVLFSSVLFSSALCLTGRGGSISGSAISAPALRAARRRNDQGGAQYCADQFFAPIIMSSHLLPPGSFRRSRSMLPCARRAPVTPHS